MYAGLKAVGRLVVALQVALWLEGSCLEPWAFCLHHRCLCYVAIVNFTASEQLMVHAVSGAALLQMHLELLACPITRKLCSHIPLNIQSTECCLQISRAILGQDQKLRLPKFLEEEEKSPEATKQVLLTVWWLMMPMCEKSLRSKVHSASRSGLNKDMMRVSSLCCSIGCPVIHSKGACCPLLQTCQDECVMQDLADKIAQLNSAIDDVSSQLKASDSIEEATLTSCGDPDELRWVEVGCAA